MEPEEDYIEVSDLKESTAYYRETLYFTGGIVGIPSPEGGIGLTPVRGPGEIQAIPNVSWPTFQRLAAQCGIRFVGTSQTITGSGSVPDEVWRPSFAPAPGQLEASQSWAAISHQAHRKGDAEYERSARSLSVSLHSAGVRLRNVAKAHHDQLCWALEDGRKSGSGFSNTALLTLHAEFQALATELCSARDHLAKLAALTAGAKGSVDSMARLEDWLGKAGNAPAHHVPIVAWLVANWGSKSSPLWLRDLGTLRNKLVHEEPMAASTEARMLRLVDSTTDAGVITTIRLSPHHEDIVDAIPPDPFVAILDLYNKMEQLGRKTSEVAKFPPKLLNFIVKE